MPRIENDVKLDFKDVLLKPKRSTLASRNDMDLLCTYKFRHSGKQYTGIPVMSANTEVIGTFEVAKALAKHDLFTCINKFYSLDDWKKFAKENPTVLKNVAVTIGIASGKFEMLCSILREIPEIEYVCMTIANGYMERFVNEVKRVRATFPSLTIMAGDVATAEMVQELILAGADVIKVGIGPGSLCTTRKQTGVGYPQLSAVLECAEAAHGLGAHIISDGGCVCNGDVAKALGAGADFVMIGGMFAGHDQCAGDVIVRNENKFKMCYGSSSATSMNLHQGGVGTYRASEGKTVEVPYRGDIENTVRDMLGSLRSTCTYVGATKLMELPTRATFIRVSQQTNDIFASNVVGD